ncbi:MAG: TetR/AcrR family transcriptional regulator [Betaproteobacteria bacterium]|nr:TetR/AcrR family transcriptional regulator [Betaproteobacteria bacterium]
MFAVSDYASASMAAIAQACSVSKATLYHYFQAKDDLLFHALDHSRIPRLYGCLSSPDESA